ncbi:protein-glutamate O-methyltransferase CheR [Pyxidicoccus parkwayensis]|uniref:protein-glutamate O-methyltransferase n=1 Tax=Pyxidicoccus parkwayensis TaxID=2813578 RepID=A0ABX7NMC2_9BACT|nr:protein-glutamate O-methyltransferase CheR [Pyxidicoccus parkwaysis]QSQ20006.1 protein-glutamate O-methyltransferase CheR [Pyxidicoccus parkwaysis]
MKPVGPPSLAQAPLPEPAALTRLRECFYAEAGVRLGDGKAEFVRWRLSARLRALGLESFMDYAARVTVDAAERKKMVEALLVHETRFFREPAQFTWLERELFPHWRHDSTRRRSRHVRAWSAACSTGQEPYSLAMLLLAHLPAEEGWSVEVLGTDLSGDALARAEAAMWPMEKASEIPTAYLHRFMLRGTGPAEGWIRAGPQLRSAVRFQPLNLLRVEDKVPGIFDLVMCRNVLIYFDAASSARALRGLVRCLAPDGLLLLGHAEGLHGMRGMRAVHSSIYTRASGTASP